MCIFYIYFAKVWQVLKAWNWLWCRIFANNCASRIFLYRIKALTSPINHEDSIWSFLIPSPCTLYFFVEIIEFLLKIDYKNPTTREVLRQNPPLPKRGQTINPPSLKSKRGHWSIQIMDSWDIITSITRSKTLRA